MPRNSSLPKPTCLFQPLARGRYSWFPRITIAHGRGGQNWCEACLTMDRYSVALIVDQMSKVGEAELLAHTVSSCLCESKKKDIKFAGASIVTESEI